jgi:tetratricopeptide (TPR) repeat protein
VAVGGDEQRAELTDQAESIDPADLANGDESASWGNLWQAPTIVLSLALIGLGLWHGAADTPEIDYNAVFDGIEQLIAAEELDAARNRIQTIIEPTLAERTPEQQARHHQIVGDWLAVSWSGDVVRSASVNQSINEAYATAVELGGVLGAVQLERWADVLIDLGRLDSATQRIDELEAIAFAQQDSTYAMDSCGRLRRRIVDATLRRDDLGLDERMAVLEDYRANPALDPSDQAWAAATQARLRLRVGDADRAVTRLILDIRRFEDAQPPLSSADWGELHLLLGQCYFELGDYDDAGFNIDLAMRRLPESDVRHGEGLLVLGRIALALGEIEQAADLFDQVVRGYIGSGIHLHALLARAETKSILGDHDAALTDYREIIKQIASAERPLDIASSRIAASLADRHDAALTMGDLDRALSYVSLAETLFIASDVPIDVLYRIASTSRQIADNTIDQGLAELGDAGLPQLIEKLPPEVRRDAGEAYRRAGDYFMRHARGLAAVADADAAWADSLFLAGESFDLAGRRDKAIEHYFEYIAGRSVDDPRRAEVVYRLARAHHAELDYDLAAEAYQQVIDEHPRSTFGTQSHVPLAQCLVELGRAPEAERQLTAVLNGQYAITPDAIDYRNAQIALGRLHHGEGQYDRAIIELSSAVERYVDDERINELRFWLGDSHRLYAAQLARTAAEQRPMTPDEQASLMQRSTEHYDRALAMFSAVCDGFGAVEERLLDRLQRDMLRHAMLYRGDCAFNLARYADAARYYDRAARTYSDHHCSINALVQIINCFDMLNDSARADIAHHNAMIRLNQLPDEVFDDPEAIMDRQAWEQWLRNRPVGLAQGASDSPPE